MINWTQDSGSRTIDKPESGLQGAELTDIKHDPSMLDTQKPCIGNLGHGIIQSPLKWEKNKKRPFSKNGNGASTVARHLRKGHPNDNVPENKTVDKILDMSKFNKKKYQETLMSDQIAVFIDFENVALWAEQEFLDFELMPLMEYLQSRGPVVIKRVYGDWSRFARYRDDLMNNAVDLIQIYNVRAGKNRADIRMALDAMEIAIQRTHIKSFVIVSGDSDFGPLVSKLREYGRYTLGIGPRDVTHPLLIKACDEFVYLEAILEQLNQISSLNEVPHVDTVASRSLLDRALIVHSQRGELPVLASQLKQTMLLMDPACNEANFGYSQFTDWLENHNDMIQLLAKDLQVYVSPINFAMPGDGALKQWEVIPNPSNHTGNGAHPATSSFSYPPEEETVSTPRTIQPISLRLQYKQILSRLKMTAVDFNTRRDVLRDIYRELAENSESCTTDQLLDALCERYEGQGLIRSKTTLRQIWQMGFRQRTFDYNGEVASVHTPVQLAEDIDSEAAFVQRAESGFVYAVINAGLEIDKSELAMILLNDPDQTDYIDSLLEDLDQQSLITDEDGRYTLPGGNSSTPLHNDPIFEPLWNDIQKMQLPESLPRSQEKARALAKTAMLQRSQDFTASARSYLCACRLQWEVVQNGDADVSQEDLRWFMASYASVKAGELSQIHRDYRLSRPYYLAFFRLVQEDDPLWSRMRGLINPMLSYYWINAWRELGIGLHTNNSGNSSPAEIAVRAATHEDPELCRLWFEMTNGLSEVNPGLLRRIASQIRFSRPESPIHRQVAETIDQMLIA